MSTQLELLPCPFCGGPAQIEAIETALDVTRYSVGCNDGEGDCLCQGYQSLTTFARRIDAAKAWNTRSAPAQAAPSPEAADSEAVVTDRSIILGLFNPMPDKHASGCLAHQNGPCICGYAEVAGKYLWALREAKKIASSNYGKAEVDASRRLDEPHELVEVAATFSPDAAAQLPQDGGGAANG